jgi:hypothetical protein
MKKYARFDLPGIAYLSAIFAGILLFMLLGESFTGIKPNLIWIAGITGFFVCPGHLMAVGALA